jgi:hypothetical protein
MPGLSTEEVQASALSGRLQICVAMFDLSVFRSDFQIIEAWPFVLTKTRGSIQPPSTIDNASVRDGWNGRPGWC